MFHLEAIIDQNLEAGKTFTTETTEEILSRIEPTENVEIAHYLHVCKDSEGRPYYGSAVKREGFIVPKNRIGEWSPPFNWVKYI